MPEDPDDLLAGLSDLIAKGGMGPKPTGPKATEEAGGPDSDKGPEAEDEPFEVRLERAEREVNGLVP